MRKYQLTIKLDCFHEPGKTETIRVYADANNVWETICAGFHQLIDIIKSNGFRLPSFGAVNTTVGRSEWKLEFCKESTNE